jgi:hypothetical protein
MELQQNLIYGTRLRSHHQNTLIPAQDLAYGFEQDSALTGPWFSLQKKNVGSARQSNHYCGLLCIVCGVTACGINGLPVHSTRA